MHKGPGSCAIFFMPACKHRHGHPGGSARTGVREPESRPQITRFSEWHVCLPSWKFLTGDTNTIYIIRRGPTLYRRAMHLAATTP